MATVPVAAWFGVLTYAQLCVVAAVQTGGAIVFAAAIGAHLKRLVPEPHRAQANSRFETSLWSATTVGPPTGGLLASWPSPSTPSRSCCPRPVSAAYAAANPTSHQASAGGGSVR